MPKQGKLWPTSQDKQPIVSVFHVPLSPLTAPQAEHTPGQCSFEVTESSVSVEDRLKDTFPLYRIAAFGRQLLNLTKA